MGKARMSCLLVVVVAALLGLAAPASAHQIYPYEYEKSFNGAGTTAGTFSNGLTKVAINQETGTVYVLDQRPVGGCCQEQNWVSQFNASGTPQPFLGLPGVSSINLGTGGADMVYDNTGHHEGLWVF